MSSLAFPCGVAPGFDSSHPASATAQASVIAMGANFINLFTGLPGVLAGTIATAAPKTVGLIGPAFGGGTQGGNYQSTFGGVKNPAASTPWTCAAIIFTPSTFASNAQALICQGTNNTDAGGFYIRINQTTGALLATAPAGTTPSASTFNLVVSTPYFVVTSSGPTSGVNITNYVAINLNTGQVFSSATTGSLPAIGVGNSVALLAQASRGFSGYLAAGMTNIQFMSMSSLFQWAADPWSFWYPSK